MRLGHNGPIDVKSHPWLKQINWSELLEMKTIAPFKTKLRGAILTKP